MTDPTPTPDPAPDPTPDPVPPDPVPPTPAELDLAVIAAMRDLAVARQASTPDPDAIQAARAALLDARAARGY